MICIEEPDTASLLTQDPLLVTFTLDQVARFFDVSRRSLSDYVSRGELHAVRFGRKKRVTLAELRRFLSTSETGSREVGKRMN